VVVGLSVGIVLATPGTTADTLLAAADEALYGIKRAGGGGGGLGELPPT